MKRGTRGSAMKGFILLCAVRVQTIYYHCLWIPGAKVQSKSTNIVRNCLSEDNVKNHKEMQGCLLACDIHAIPHGQCESPTRARCVLSTFAVLC